MGRTSIVTDSASGLTREEARQLGISVIPIHIEIGGRTYHEGVDLSLSEYHQLVSSDTVVPATSPPTVREFHDLFRQLGRESDEIIAVHLSSRLGRTLSVARQAAQTYLGRTRVTPVDSRLVATPLGWLAKAAAEAASAGVDTREIVRLLRAMIPRMYVAFFVESMEQLHRAGLAPRPPAITPASAAVKPLLMIEDGETVILERSRSRGGAVERLYQFVAEFPRVERLAILQGKPLPESIELATLINEEMPEQEVETSFYPASVAAYVGSSSLGVAIYEGAG
ncbi:MAG: DegV family protein [Anaerolineae bacterium]|nr:DegV family protein [Anaerolineae bacterium]